MAEHVVPGASEPDNQECSFKGCRYLQEKNPKYFFSGSKVWSYMLYPVSYKILYFYDETYSTTTMKTVCAVQWVSRHLQTQLWKQTKDDTQIPRHTFLYRDCPYGTQYYSLCASLRLLFGLCSKYSPHCCGLWYSVCSLCKLGDQNWFSWSRECSLYALFFN